MLRGVLHIAANEAQRYVRLVDRNLLLGAAIAGVIVGLAWPTLSEQGVHPDEGLYVVEAEEGSDLIPVLQSNERFQIKIGLQALFWRHEADLLVIESLVHFDPASEKSRAAARELELTSRRWLDAKLETEPDADAAFPVRVHLVYQPRVLTGPPEATTAPGATQAPNATAEPEPAPNPRILEQFDPQSVSTTPNNIDPPFPVRSLILTFAYLVPLNFVSQFYAGSLYAERLRQRGVLLLSAPYSGAEILLGKSLPYIAFTVVFGIAVTLVIGSNLYGLLAMLPVLGFLLAASLLMALLARSQRELTFLLVTFTVLLSTFLFLPAIFTEVHPVSFLSPVTVVIASLEGDPIGLGSFLYATLPLTIATVVLASLALALYKEEELFAPQKVLSKLANAVHTLAPTPAMLVVVGAFAVPFAIGLELFILIFAVTLDLQSAFVIFLLGGAFIEEALKALPVYAHHTRYAVRPRAAWVVGGSVGLGFFLGEKFALIFALLGFGLLPLGTDALATFGIATAPLLIIAPLFLHVGTATLVAHAARRGKTPALLGWFAASILHATYNTLILFYHVAGGIT